VAASDMAASNTFGPDQPGEMSAREKKILDGIEDDMLTADPILAHQMTRAAWPRPGARWRAAARHCALLIAALIILIIAAAVLPPTWWAVLGLLTTVLLVPWICSSPPAAPTESEHHPNAAGMGRRERPGNAPDSSLRHGQPRSAKASSPAKMRGGPRGPNSPRAAP
jgi:hypothetical protein